MTIKLKFYFSFNSLCTYTAPEWKQSVCVCVCVCVWSTPTCWSALSAQLRGYYPIWNKCALASFPSSECCLAASLSEPRKTAIRLRMAENTRTHTHTHRSDVIIGGWICGKDLVDVVQVSESPEWAYGVCAPVYMGAILRNLCCTSS